MAPLFGRAILEYIDIGTRGGLFVVLVVLIREKKSIQIPDDPLDRSNWLKYSDSYSGGSTASTLHYYSLDFFRFAGIVSACNIGKEKISCVQGGRRRKTSPIL